MSCQIRALSAMYSNTFSPPPARKVTNCARAALKGFEVRVPMYRLRVSMKVSLHPFAKFCGGRAM